MAFTYSEWDTTPANIVADIKTKTLLSADWSNPTGQVLQATAANGATMAVDLIGQGAADSQRLRPKFYRLFSAGSGTDALQRSLYWGSSVNQTSSSPLHCRLAAGNTLWYLDIEGPRGGEAGADNAAAGSLRQVLFIAQLTAYFAGDTTAAVVVGGSSSYPGTEGSNVQNLSQTCHVSRNQGNTTAWVQGKLTSLVVPMTSGAPGGWTYQPTASDGNTYLLPYVLFEDAAGIRGRLADLYYAGMQASVAMNLNETVSGLAAGQSVTYGGNTYKVLAPYRGNSTTSAGGSLGANSSASSQYSALAAVRTA